MFNDINSIYKLPLNQVKSSPSVNSPNDGAFNSEENVRWANKKLTTKPFIYGRTEQDVENSLGKDVRLGWYGAYCGDAMLSIDGYLIKVANNENISYDAEHSLSGPDIDLMPAQLFIADLANCGTDKELSTEYSDFLFTEFDPSTQTITSDLIEKWQDASKDGTVIGFIKSSYTNSYRMSLSSETDPNSGTEYIVYENNKIAVNNLITVTSPNDLRYITATTPRTEPIAQTISDGNNIITQIDIFYPITLTKAKKYTSNSETYDTVYKLGFTDIYSITFTFDTISAWSHVYPYTSSVFADMDNHAPLDALSFSNCDATTMPSKAYNYVSLYQTDGSKLVRKSFDSQETTDYRYNAQFPMDMFEYKTLTELMSNFPVPVSADYVPEIRSTMGYYCIKFDTTLRDLCIRGTNSLGQSYDVPIAFMGSNGAVTPNGFVIGYDNKYSPTYPVEGYLHFIKRLYLMRSAADPTDYPTEEQINAVTVQDLVSWTTASEIPANGNSGAATVNFSFNTFYQEYLYPLICMHMNLSYSSLMDNVVFNTYTDNFKTMKACGCGKALLGTAGTEDNNTFVGQAYTHAGYRNNNGILEEVSDMVDTIEYHKDYLSDETRIRFRSVYPNATQLLGNYWYRPKFSLDTTASSTSANYFEDPINVIRRCMVNQASYTGAATVTDTNNTVFYTTTGGTMQETVIDNISRYIAIDDFLFPLISDFVAHPSNIALIPQSDFVATIATEEMVSINGFGYSRTLAVGMTFITKLNTWSASIPYVATLQKDSLNYLSGKDYEDGLYGGIKFRFMLNTDDMEPDDLLIFMYNGSTVPKIHSYDGESFNLSIDIYDPAVKTAREAFIHVSKVYDGDRELGMILDDVQEDVENFKTDVESSITEISNTVSNLETTVYGDTDVSGLVTQITQINTRLNNSFRVLERGELGSASITYTIYGESLSSGKNICVIDGQGTIPGFDPIWTPEEEIVDPNPLWNKNIHSIYVNPGITRIEEYVFAFNFNDLHIPYTVEYMYFIVGSEETSVPFGPRYIDFSDGFGTGSDIAFCLSGATALKSVVIPRSMSSVYRSGGDALTSIYYKCPVIDGDGNIFTCNNLTKCVLDGTRLITGFAFDGCPQLTDLTYVGTLSDWATVTKNTNWDVTRWDEATSTVLSRLSAVHCIDGDYVYDSTSGTWS